MPIFEINGQKYNVEDQYIDAFSKENPDATTIEDMDGQQYRVRAKDYRSFLTSFDSVPFEKGTTIIGGTGTQEEADRLFDLNQRRFQETDPNKRAALEMEYNNLEKRIKEREQKNFRDNLESNGEIKRLQEIQGRAQLAIDKASFFDRFFDADTRAAVAARNQAEEALETYEEAKHAEEGWFDRNVLGVFRGIGDKIGDLSTWDFGASGVASGVALKNVSDKLDRGEKLTAAEQNMIDAFGLASAVQTAYQNKVGMAYKAGGSLPESAAFRVSLMLNPAAGVGRKIAESAAKAAVKKFGTSMVSKLAKGAARVGGDALEMAVATAVPGAGRIAEDYYNRVNGQSTFDVDENGIIRYGGQVEQEEADDAIWKAFGSQFIENYSESVGNYFSPMGTMLSNLTSKGLKSAHLGKLADVVNDISSSQFSRGLKRFKDATKFDGFVGEYLEEVAGNFMNAATVGDMNFNSPDDPRSVFNPEVNMETALSCALMSGTMYAVEAPVSIYNRRVAKKNLSEADKAASELWGDRWDDMRSQMDEADPQLLAQLLTGINNATDLSDEAKQAAKNYATRLMQMQGYNARRLQNQMESTEEANAINNAYDRGADMVEPADKHNAKIAMDKAEAALADDSSFLQEVINGQDNPVATITAMVESGKYSDDQIAKAKDYYVAYRRMNGLTDSVLERVNSRINDANKEVDANTNVDENTGARTIVPVTLRDGRQGYVLKGTVTPGEKGSIDVNKSDSYIVVRVDGKNLPMNPNKDLVSVGQITAPESLKEYNSTQLREQLINEEIGEIDWNPSTPNPRIGDSFEMDGIAVTIVDQNGQGGMFVVPTEEWQAAQGSEQKVQQLILQAQQAGSVPASMFKQWASNQLDAQEEAVKVEQEVASGEAVSEQVTSGVNTEVNNPEANGENVPPVEVAQQPQVKAQQTPVIPTKEDGSIDFVTYGKEGSFKILGEKYGEKMPHKVEVTANAFAEDVVKAQKKLDDAQQKLDDAPIGRDAKQQAARDNAKQELDAIKVQADFWAEMDADIKAAQARRNEMLNPKVEANMNEDPISADEFVAQQLSNGNITLTSESFKKETGYGEEERKKFIKIIQRSENGGMTIEEAGERLMEMDRENGTNFFDQSDPNAGRDAIIDMLGMARTWGDITNYIRNNRQRQVKTDEEGIRSEMEEAIWNAYHVTPEEYVTMLEMEMQENPYEGIDLAALDAIFAEKEFGEEQKTEEYESGTDVEGNQGQSELLSEERVGDTTGNQPGETVEQAEGIGSGTKVEGKTAQAGTSVSRGVNVFEEAERIDKEEQRRKPLRERAREWSKTLGVKVNFIERFEDVKNKTVIRAINEGQQVAGWFELGNGEVYFYMPNLESMDEVDKTYIHEVVSHKGLLQLLGKEKFDELCDKVWDMMPQSARNEFMSYPGVNGNKRIAADEYIAYLSESVDLTPEEKTIWDNIVQFFREALDNALKGIIGKSRITNEDIANLIKASYANLKANSSNEVLSQIEKAREEVDQNPTEAQKESGNYKKGHVKIDGYDITIENPKGGVRSGTDKNGKKWSITMNNDYGYIRNTEAVDGDHIDVFLSDNPTEGRVFVVDQRNEDGSFDESKVMYGFNSLEEAREAYLSNYEKGWESRIMAITEVSKDEFKKWIDSSHRKTKAFSEYKSVKTDSGQGYSIEETNVSRMSDIEERLTEIEGEIFEIEDRLNELGSSNPIASAELISSLYQLEREQEDLESEYSGLRAMNDESNAILEEEGSELRFKVYKSKDGKETKYKQLSLFGEGHETANDGGRPYNVQREGNSTISRLNHLRELQEGEICNVERRFTESREFSFTRGEKVESTADIAYIFKSLEDEAVENSFVAIANGDNITVVHLGMGAQTQTVVDTSAIIAAVERLNADKVFFVHNHPSGEVRCSKQDILTYQSLKKVLGSRLEDGIIINTRSGKYGLFNSDGLVDANGKIASEKTEYPINVYKFNKQAFNVDVIPTVEPSSSGIAEFVSTQRLGKRDKVNALLLNNQFGCVGNILIDNSKNLSYITERITNDAIAMGARQVVVYGRYPFVEVTNSKTNFASYLSRMISEYSQGNVNLIDIIQIDEPYSRSANDEGVRFRRVYHGSAADFDKFDRNFSGSGEGQAVMGAGHYVTTSEGTGRYYAEVASDMRRKVVQEGGYTYNGKVIRSRTLVDAYEALKKNEFDVDKAIESIEHRIAVIRRLKGDKANTTNAEEAIRLLNEEKANKGTLGYQEEILEKPARHLYEVEIPDDNGKNYFDLDKKATKKTKDEAKRRLYSALENSEETEYWKKNRDIIEDEWRYNVNTSDATNDSVRATMEQFLTQEEVADILSDMGYIGSKSKATDGTTYIIYKDDSLEIKNNTRFRVSNRNQEIFVSNAQKAVESIKQEKATPQQWLAMIEKNSGLKAGEDKWLGLSDWLKASDKKLLTKDEILDFINQNKIMIEEVKYSQNATDIDDLFDEYEALYENEGAEAAHTEMIFRYGEEFDSAFKDVGGELRIVNQKVVDNLLSKSINSTRLNYTTEDLENKSEIALTVPNIEPWNKDDEIHFGDAGKGRAIAWIRFGETTAPQADLEKAAREADDALTAYQNELAEKYLEDGGSGDPTEYLDMINEEERKHMRELSGKMIDARDAADANQVHVLVIDEIQSKRHQEGREKGYMPIGIRNVQLRMQEIEERLEELGRIESASDYGLTDEQLDEQAALLAEERELVKSGTIPAAPFEKNWSELAFKRMLRYAAENGYDKVAWTTGAQQADRYNLSKFVDNIRCNRVGKNGNKSFVLEGIDYNVVTNNEGLIVAGVDEFKGKHLSEIVGSSLVDKMLGMKEGDVLNNTDLRIGGEGMKGFYDKMLPSFVNKYVKKWGTKVQDIELPNLEEAGRIMHSVDVTDAMKESVMEGQTMFRISDKGRKIQQEVDKFTSKYNSKEVVLVDSEMTNEELEEVVPFSSAKRTREEISNGYPGGYSPNTDKIYIFVDNQDLEDSENTMFHENLHPLFNNSAMVEEFYGNAKVDKKALIEALSEVYSESEIPNEMFAHMIARDLSKSNYKFAEKYLSKESRNGLFNTLKEFGYDRSEEESIRRGQENVRGNIQKDRKPQKAEQVDSGLREGKASQREELKRLFEQVADMGLDGVLGNKAYTSAMVDIYKSLPEDVRSEVAEGAISNYGGSVAPAVSDYLNHKEANVWDKVVGVIKDALRKVGFDVKLTANDVKYLLWRSQKPLNRKNILDVAEDIDALRRFGTSDNTIRFSIKKKGNFDVSDKRDKLLKEYDAFLKTGKFNFIEAFQDRMYSLKVLMDKIVEATGKKVRDYEDAYKAENQLGSINKPMQERYLKNFYKPLLEAIKVLSDKYGREAVERYIYCKSGLERNVVLRQRDVDESYNSAKVELDEKLTKNEIDQAQYNILLQQAEDQRNKTLSEDVDYSGIRGMLFNSKAQNIQKEYEEGKIDKSTRDARLNNLEANRSTATKDWKKFAESQVAFLEGKASGSELDALWDRINAATNETLRMDYESGMIDKETYDAEKNMMKYYVPLRNWDDATAEEMYEYRSDLVRPVSSNQKRAKGRESQADNPIATIGLMAQSAIVRGNRNKVKQKFYAFVANRETSLATVRDVWYVKDPSTGDWTPQYADTSSAKNSSEFDAIIAQFEEDMKRLEEQGQTFRGKLPFGMKFRASASQKRAHVVPVMINGIEYAVYVNGNPRAAQAINGETNNESVKNTSEWMDKLKRLYGAGLTSWNPDFIIPNLVRDTIHASTMTMLDSGPIAAIRYMFNTPKMFWNVGKIVTGLGNADPKLEAYFKEFVDNGGETGYTAINTLEDYKKEYEKLIDEAKGIKASAGKNVKKAFGAMAKILEAANRIAEDVNRFNAYVSARESGETIIRSVDAAKNITVNFNRKGALSANDSAFGSVANAMSKWILFFNPAVQGIAQIVAKSKMNPKRAASMGATILASGFMMPMLNEMLVAAAGDDEEDDYWNQSDYKRRNNWMLFTGDGYMTFPLPPILRELYGIGDVIYGTITGHITAERAAMDIARQVQSAVGFFNLIPEVSQEPDMVTYVKGFAPDIAAPILDVISNTNFMGRPIAKWTDYNKYDPEYERVYKGTSKHWVELSMLLNEAGGNEGKRSDLWGNFINPAMMEHLITSYGGGIGKTINNLIGMALAEGEDNVDPFRKTPIIPRFYTPNDEKTVVPGINRKYYDYNYKYNVAKKALKNYQEGIASGEHPEWQKYIDEMKRNKEIEFINYFKEMDKKLKKLQNLLKGNPTNKESLEEQIVDLKAKVSAKSWEILK